MTGIQGINFDNQTVTAKDHGQIYHCLISDGKVSGCTITKTATSLTIAKGYMMVGGRLIKLASAQTLTVTTPASIGFVRIVVSINLQNTATQSTFNQVTLRTEFNTSVAGFPALTKQDINGTGTLYEYEYCIYNASTSGIGTVKKSPEQAKVDLSSLGTVTTEMGGTGRTTLPVGGVLFGNGTNPVSYASPGAAGTVLVSNGANTAPSFKNITVLGTVTTGVWQGTAIAMNKGGTGATNGEDGLKNLLAAGATVLSVYQYGNTLPTPGLAGRLFFKTI